MTKKISCTTSDISNKILLRLKFPNVPGCSTPAYPSSRHIKLQLLTCKVLSKEVFHSYVKANDAVMRTCKLKVKKHAKKLDQSLRHAFKFVASNTASTSGTLPSNTVTNPKEDLKVMERDTEVTKDMMHPTNNGSIEDVPPPVVPVVYHESISEPANTPVSASRPNQKASIPFPSRRNDERTSEKDNGTNLRNL
ncbi:hypothetical protein Tco_0712485 [Tanacetum coccineum]